MRVLVFPTRMGDYSTKWKYLTSIKVCDETNRSGKTSKIYTCGQRPSVVAERKALTIIQRETASLAAQGPTADEFIRAHQPYLHQMSDDRRTNAYWGGTVLADAQLHPHRLSSARDRSPDVAAITAADLAKLAKRHFTAKNIFTFMTVPEFSPAPGAPPR